MSVRWLVVLGLVISCGAAPSTGTQPSPKVATAAVTVDAAPRYELRVEVDVAGKEISVEGTVSSPSPRSRFFLNEALTLDELVVGSEAMPFVRDKNRVDLPRPITSFHVRYHGRLLRKGGDRDFKTDAWMEPGGVRLTEATAFYPILYDGEGTFPWPPVPGVGRIEVGAVEGLHWVTSSQRQDGKTFWFIEPSDFVLVGVPFESTSIPLSPPHSSVSLDVYSPRSAALGPVLTAAFGAHLDRFGPLREPKMNVVEFDSTGTNNGLAFLTSSLIVLSAKTCDYVVQGTPRALRVVSHEFAHRWFGGDLRATGPATRWLVEAFAEYYAWRVVREKLGEPALQTILSEVRSQAGTVPVRIPDLGWDDERVYTAGALGVLALADAAGEHRLDAAVRTIVSSRGEWSAANLLRVLREQGADVGALDGFRSAWGL